MKDSNFPAWLAQRARLRLPGASAHATMMPKDVIRPEAKNAPPSARQSAVLMLLYEKSSVWKIILIARSDDGGPHGGQLALPGGSVEETDLDLIATAFRESQEEIALPISAADYIATLSTLYIPLSNFLVTPIVAFAKQLPKLSPSAVEVADIKYVSLQDMYDTIAEVQIKTSRGSRVVKAYTLNDGAVVWGATAMMLAELGILWSEFKTQKSA